MSLGSCFEQNGGGSVSLLFRFLSWTSQCWISSTFLFVQALKGAQISCGGRFGCLLCHAQSTVLFRLKPTIPKIQFFLFIGAGRCWYVRGARRVWWRFGLLCTIVDSRWYSCSGGCGDGGIIIFWILNVIIASTIAIWRQWQRSTSWLLCSISAITIAIRMLHLSEREVVLLWKRRWIFQKIQSIDELQSEFDRTCLEVSVCIWICSIIFRWGWLYQCLQRWSSQNYHDRKVLWRWQQRSVKTLFNPLSQCGRGASNNYPEQCVPCMRGS